MRHGCGNCGWGNTSNVATCKSEGIVGKSLSKWMVGKGVSTRQRCQNRDYDPLFLCLALNLCRILRGHGTVSVCYLTYHVTVTSVSERVSGPTVNGLLLVRQKNDPECYSIVCRSIAIAVLSDYNLWMWLFVFYSYHICCRQQQQILLVMAVHAACFGRTDRPQALST